MYPRRWRQVVKLQISIRECGDVSILDFWGKAAIGRESEFLSKQLHHLFANGERKVLLNLANLAQIDSSSVSIIVAIPLSPLDDIC
jgi:anti-anti-sigma regulatory factor